MKGTLTNGTRDATITDGVCDCQLPSCGRRHKCKMGCGRNTYNATCVCLSCYRKAEKAARAEGR